MNELENKRAKLTAWKSKNYPKHIQELEREIEELQQNEVLNIIHNNSELREQLVKAQNQLVKFGSFFQKNVNSNMILNYNDAVKQPVPNNAVVEYHVDKGIIKVLFEPRNNRIIIFDDNNDISVRVVKGKCEVKI